jgi:hypothetical protein
VNNMKSKYLKILAVCLIALLVIIYFTGDVDESFEIERLDYSVFKIGGKDSLSKCYTLNSKIEEETDTAVYLIGLRLKIHRISKEHEGFLTFFDKEPIDKGHTDTISYIQLINLKEEVLNNVVEAANVKYFKLIDTVITNHSISNIGNCFESIEGMSLDKFKDWYNGLTWADPKATGFFFFRISQNMGFKLLSNQVSLVFKLKNGQVLKAFKR